MVKVIFGIWGFIMLISISITGALAYLAYTVVTKPELVRHWFSVVTGG